MESTPIICVKNLTYNHPAVVIQNVSFELEPGQCFALVGRNGTGKTTLLSLLAGLMRPHAGSILINGIDLSQNPLAAKQRMGFLPDKPPLYPELTIDEYLTFTGRLRYLPPETLKTRINDVTEELNLTRHRHHLIGSLSKGQQQRVGLASVLLHKPSLLLLDEPTQGLDPTQIEDFHCLLSEYLEETSIILSTHYLNEVESLCDAVLEFSLQGMKRHDLHHCST